MVHARAVRRIPSLIASAVIFVLAALAAERLARARPGAGPTSPESNVLWIAGYKPAFPCSADGLCRTDPELVRLANADRSFSFTASSGTFRLICVGDSTTAGWPYQPHGGYPEWLGEILRDALPGRRVEVLNLGVHAWDGARLESVFDQALSLRPGAVILRIGYDDYPHFHLRHPRGGAAGRAWRDIGLFLLAHSAAYRSLARAAAPVPRRGVDVLTPDEEERLLADHRDRLERLVRSARAAGTPLIVLGLPNWSRFARTFHGMPSLNALALTNAAQARALGAPFVPLTELSGRKHFIDHVHSNLEGYRLTALAIARARWPPRGCRRNRATGAGSAFAPREIRSARSVSTSPSTARTSRLTWRAATCTTTIARQPRSTWKPRCLPLRTPI